MLATFIAGLLIWLGYYVISTLRSFEGEILWWQLLVSLAVTMALTATVLERGIDIEVTTFRLAAVFVLGLFVALVLATLTRRGVFRDIRDWWCFQSVETSKEKGATVLQGRFPVAVSEEGNRTHNEGE